MEVFNSCFACARQTREAGLRSGEHRSAKGKSEPLCEGAWSRWLCMVSTICNFALGEIIVSNGSTHHHLKENASGVMIYSNINTRPPLLEPPGSIHRSGLA